MNIDDQAQAPLANSTCERSIESREPDAMSVDHFPGSGDASAVTSGTTAGKEQMISRSRPNYQTKFILSGHTMSVSSLKFSPDGNLLASSGTLVMSI